MISDKLKKELLESLLIFILVFSIFALGPFLLSGVWPPFTSILSGSMEPNINTGDMVYIVDNERFVSDSNSIYGVSPAENEETKSFNEYGDVIIFYPNGDDTKTPVIHRADVYVEKGDDWVSEVDNNLLRACNNVENCPAPHNGFITIGDNNSEYDQIGGISEPVKEEWIIGKAQYRVPFVGLVRNTIEYIFGKFTIPALYM